MAVRAGTRYRKGAPALGACLLAGGLSVATASVGFAGSSPPPLGEEFQVNTHTTGAQDYCSVAANAAGDFVVAWRGPDANYFGVFGQRYDRSGTPAGPEFQVNTYTTNTQGFPEAAADAAGDFVVVWHSMGQDGASFGIFGQRFGADGTPLGAEFQVNTYTTSGQQFPDVAMDAAGGFVVVWSGFGDQDGSEQGIFGQRYDASGIALGGEFQVNTYTTGEQRLGVVAANSSGGFVVVWHSGGQDGSEQGIFGQRYDPDGAPLGGEFQVNTYTTARQRRPRVAAGPAGDFVVVWQSGPFANGYSIFGQRYDASGNPAGSEFQVNTDGGDMYPAVAVDGSGSFMVVWQSPEVLGRLYDASGNPTGDEFQVNSYTTGHQSRPAVAGSFVVVWESADQDGSSVGIFGQRYLGPTVFADGFESGDTSGWDQAVP